MHNTQKQVLLKYENGIGLFGNRNTFHFNLMLEILFLVFNHGGNAININDILCVNCNHVFCQNC